MTSRDFCYWLQGFFEISKCGTTSDPESSMTAEQAETVRRHLALVFKHEIDPSMGDQEEQEKLNNIHNSPKLDLDTIYRC